MRKSLEIVNDKIVELKDTYQHYTAVEKDKVKSSFAKFDIEQFQQIKQDLEVLETILDNCENKFLDILQDCLIRGTPIHTEDIQRLSGYINKILTIKTMVGGE